MNACTIVWREAIEVGTSNTLYYYLAISIYGLDST